MPWQLHSTPHERPKIQQRCPHLGIYRKKGEKLLNFFSCSFPLFLLFLYISCIFCLLFLFCCVWGYRSSFVGALMDLLKLYLLPTSSFWSWGTVSGWSQSGVMSISGKLFGWFMNLAALPFGLGFNSQSSEGCLGLRSPMLHLLVLPLIWFSTTAGHGDVSLTTLMQCLSDCCKSFVSVNATSHNGQQSLPTSTWVSFMETSSSFNGLLFLFLAAKGSQDKQLSAPSYDQVYVSLECFCLEALGTICPVWHCWSYQERI